MKKKIKIIIPLIVFFLIGLFIKNTISADMITAPFTNTYRNSNIQTYMLDASVYAYNNVSVSQYPYDKHIRFLVMEPNLDSNGNRRYRHTYISYNEQDSQIKIYDGFIFFYVKGFVRYERKFSQNVLTGEITTGSQSIGAYSSNYKGVIKLALDKSSIKYKFNFNDSTINSVEEYIVKEISNSFQYYTGEDTMIFCELNSIGSLTGETYINNADIQNPQYYGTILSDKQKFINWIIDEKKYVVFGDYGVQNTSEFVNDIVNLYETYQKNPMKLFIEFPQFLIKNGSIFSTYDKAKELINYISALYQEFKLERRPVIYEPELLPYIFPQPWKDNSTNEIYIDDETDTTDISLLREILRVLIVMPQNIFNFFDYYMYNISVNTSLLADYVAQLPIYMTDLLYYRLSPLFENIGGDSIENITNYNIQNLYTLNDEDNPLLNLEVNINNKFPIINQTNNLVDFDNYIVDSPTAPVFTMKKPTISNMKIISTEEEIIFADFSKLSTVSTIVKSIISVFFLFYFIKWIQNYIPKLLAGYNETD